MLQRVSRELDSFTYEGGLGLVPYMRRSGFFYRRPWGLLTMVKFSYNSGLVT
jgi:hypothetical protein